MRKILRTLSALWILSSGLVAIHPAIAALDTTITLKADSAVNPTTNELVTFGLPLGAGEVLDVREINVSREGRELPIAIEAGLRWHWTDNSLRSVSIQLQGVDMSSGSVTLRITDAGRSTNDLTFLDHNKGWARAVESKGSLPFPRIFAIHDLNYLASTGLIAPYLPGDSRSGVGKLQSEEFDVKYGAMSYTETSNANWLFDRATAMLKAYMTTGDIKFLKEGFLSKRFYYSHVRNDGSAPAPAGGSGCWTFGATACADGKYIYTEPAKLAWALFGDGPSGVDSQWTPALIVNMASQANLGWNQPGTDDPYDSEEEQFTERAAGITGLAEVSAFEITGNKNVYSKMLQRIEALRDMQQTRKDWDVNNNWILSGAFTHSWANHEGGTYPGPGNVDDRRFSPWMSENIADFLWHAYQVSGAPDQGRIGEMLRQLGHAIDLFGFATSHVEGTGLAAKYIRKPGITGVLLKCGSSGNLPVELMYSGSHVASAKALQATVDGEGGYADEHNVETILPLALAAYFEPDAAARERLMARISHLERQWTVNASECVSRTRTSPNRLFNWQHRSNSVRTWEWVKQNIQQGAWTTVGSGSLEGERRNIITEQGAQILNQGIISNLTNNGTLSGGLLSGTIINNGVLTDVALVAGSSAAGGRFSGSLGGSGVVTNAMLDVSALAPGVNLGSGIKLTEDAARAVSARDLTAILRDPADGGLNIEAPLLVQPNAIGTEQALSALDLLKNTLDTHYANSDTSIARNSNGTWVISNGALEGEEISFRPLALFSSSKTSGVYALEHPGVEVVNAGLAVTSTAASWNLPEFLSILNALGASVISSDASGGIVRYRNQDFSLGFALFVETISLAQTLPGASIVNEPFSGDPLGFRFAIMHSDNRKQLLLPRVHSPAIFRAEISKRAASYEADSADGSLTIRDGRGFVTKRWLPGYLLDTTKQVSAADILDAGDLNNDGIADSYFLSGIGSQILFGLEL